MRQSTKNFSKPGFSAQALNYGFYKLSVGYREIASIIFLCRRAISGEQATECCLKADGSKTENLQKRKQYSKRKPRPINITPLRGRFKGLWGRRGAKGEIAIPLLPYKSFWLQKNIGLASPQSFVSFPKGQSIVDNIVFYMLKYFYKKTFTRWYYDRIYNRKKLVPNSC